MISEEQKKALQKISAGVIRYVMDEIESSRVEDMVNDISFTQSLYLKEIAELGNPTLSELALHMRRSKPSVTIAVDKLESKGYIRREQADADKRSFHIHLAAKGKKFYQAQKTAENKLYDKINQTLSEAETKQLIAIYKKLFGMS